MGMWTFVVRKSFAEVAGTGQRNSPRLQMLTVQVQGLGVDSSSVIGDTGAIWAHINLKGLIRRQGEARLPGILLTRILAQGSIYGSR